jgi:hypothetical protein
MSVSIGRSYHGLVHGKMSARWSKRAKTATISTVRAHDAERRKSFLKTDHSCCRAKPGLSAYLWPLTIFSACLIRAMQHVVIPNDFSSPSGQHRFSVI